MIHNVAASIHHTWVWGKHLKVNKEQAFSSINIFNLNYILRTVVELFFYRILWFERHQHTTNPFIAAGLPSHPFYRNLLLGKSAANKVQEFVVIMCYRQTGSRWTLSIYWPSIYWKSLSIPSIENHLWYYFEFSPFGDLLGYKVLLQRIIPYVTDNGFTSLIVFPPLYMWNLI